MAGDCRVPTIGVAHKNATTLTPMVHRAGMMRTNRMLTPISDR